MFSSMDWGKTGHRVVSKLAQQYLTTKAQKEIDILLDGASLVSISTYGDEIKSNPKYKALRPWHYINLPLDESYANAKKNPKGDVVMAIKKCIAKVKDQNEPKNERAFYLKLLVHFIGDLHQPMHVGRKEDRGGNSIRLQWFGKTSNLHSLWDSHLIDSHGMNATQLLGDLEELSPKLIKEIQNQSLEQWVNESQALAKIIYKNTPSNSKLGEEYQSRYLPLLKIQLQRGGLRLAAQLNEIFK
jgi:hypothetical protein